MSPRSTATWLDGSGDWAWPGRKPAVAVELGPAAWVPRAPVLSPAPAPRVAAPARAHQLPRPFRLARLALLIAVAATTFVLSRGLAHSGQRTAAVAAPLRWEGALSGPFAPRALPAEGVQARASAVGVLAPAPPEPVALSSDAAGATIASISYSSAALGWRDSYLVYLPPGYSASATRRYPVIYLLHGDGQPASSFLRLGLARTLDRLIESHAIRPLIAVMLQANGLPDNWRNPPARAGLAHATPQYNSYIGEVQRLTDRVLRTIPSRSARAIAGYSMGGFGAMNVALAQLRNYSVVESWLGYFANLGHELAADRPLLRHLPLHAFVYGGAQDSIVASSQDAPWAAALRAAGADAASAVYPGGHDFATLQAHLTAMLSFAGRELRS